MGRDHSKFNIGRNRRSTSKMPQYIIYVEGRNTEDSYLKLLKRSYCKVVPIVQRGHGIASCIDFVNECEFSFMHLSAEKRKTYKEKWLVFDYDGHQDFASAVKLARQKGFHVAFSSMCIEYWFMLHFEDHDGLPIPLHGSSHSLAQIKCINNHIKTYNRRVKAQVAEYDGDCKSVKEDFFDLMLAINPATRNRRIVDAFNRAKAIHERKLANGSETQESVTTMYQLLINLGVFTKNNDGKYEFNVK